MKEVRWIPRQSKAQERIRQIVVQRVEMNELEKIELEIEAKTKRSDHNRKNQAGRSSERRDE